MNTVLKENKNVYKIYNKNKLFYLKASSAIFRNENNSNLKQNAKDSDVI